MPQLKPITAPIGPATAARRLRISIKTLRHYEKLGLLTPKRSRAGWRVYDREQVERLEQVLAFKAMGFGLSQIATLLDATPEALSEALAAQELSLQNQAKKVADARDAVRDARRRLAPPVLKLVA